MSFVLSPHHSLGDSIREVAAYLIDWTPFIPRRKMTRRREGRKGNSYELSNALSERPNSTASSIQRPEKSATPN